MITRGGKNQLTAKRLVLSLKDDIVIHPVVNYKYCDCGKKIALRSMNCHSCRNRKTRKDQLAPQTLVEAQQKVRLVSKMITYEGFPAASIRLPFCYRGKKVKVIVVGTR